MDFVSMAMRDGITGMFSFFPARWISCSCTRGAIGGRNLPSGAVRRPSRVPVMPMNSSALSYQGDISS